MFAAILGSLVMGTLASKVGENIVGKRLGMSEKDRKMLGTVFGMAGGAYGGYAGQAGFGSSGIGATGASGSAGGMGGQSPKVGGDYGTAMNLYSQPQPQTFTGFNQPMSAAYNSPQTFTGVDAPFSSMASGNGYAGTPYSPIDNSFNPYLGPNVGNADAPALFQTNASMDPSVLIDMQGGMGVNPVYQGPSGGNVSAQTFALDAPSRTIDLAPSGIPLEVMDASAYTPPSDPFYGVDPNSPTASGSNLGMESVYNSGGNPDIELIPSTGDGYLISPTDLSTPQGVEEFINMDQIRVDEMPGGPLDPFGGERAMARVPDDMSAYGESTYAVDTPPLADIQAGQDATGIRGNMSERVAQERFRRSGPRLEDLDVVPTARLESLDNKVFANDAATSWSPTAVTGTPKTTGPSNKGALGEQVAEVKAQILQDAGDGKFDLGDVLDKIPDSVKQWAAETGVALLDMWIKQSLFGQDYDDQIAEGGGGGGGVLRGSSPVVSPYSGGGSGGGGKGVLFSMGGSGQQGRGTHIMALQ